MAISAQGQNHAFLMQTQQDAAYLIYQNALICMPNIFCANKSKFLFLKVI